MSFYVTVPSNLPGNKSNDFTTQLSKSVHLENQWEVALVEISYPLTWPNIKSRLEKETDQLTTAIYVEFTTPRDKLKINIPEGQYDTIQDLIAGIGFATEEAAQAYAQVPEENEANAQVRQAIGAKIGRRFKFHFDPLLKKVSVNFDSRLISCITISEHLKYMMGFASRQLSVHKERALYSPDMRAGVDSLYIYSDLVEPQLIGNTMANLLRIVHVDNNPHGSSVEKCFFSEHYVPVLTSNLSSIHIQIRDDRGLLIPFENGKVVCKLKFRKRRQLLFE